MSNSDKSKSFTYLGHSFSPLRKFQDSFAVVAAAIKSGDLYTDNSISFDKYNIELFYEAAKNIGAGNYDLFLLDEKFLVIPSTGGFIFLKKVPDILPSESRLII